MFFFVIVIVLSCFVDFYCCFYCGCRGDYGFHVRVLPPPPPPSGQLNL